MCFVSGMVVHLLELIPYLITCLSDETSVSFLWNTPLVSRRSQSWTDVLFFYVIYLESNLLTESFIRCRSWVMSLNCTGVTWHDVMMPRTRPACLQHFSTLAVCRTKMTSLIDWDDERRRVELVCYWLFDSWWDPLKNSTTTLSTSHLQFVIAETQ